MATRYGVLALGDALTLVNTVGQTEVWDVAQRYLAAHAARFQRMSSFLVERITEKYSDKYYLPGGGVMQRRGGWAQSHAIRTTGAWDVAFPIEEFGDQVAFTKRSVALMTLQQMQNNIETTRVRDANTRRKEMLRPIFNNTTRTFDDPEHGSITIRPLANGETDVLFPPFLNQTDEATANSYDIAGYISSAISDVNNPIILVVSDLNDRFGTEEGSGNFAVFINQAETPEIEALASFIPVDDRFIRAAPADAAVTGVPTNTPGRVLGRANGAWIIEWPSIPANYLFGMDLSVSPPIIERAHPAATRIQRGVHLVTQSSDAVNYPFDQAHYESHFGYAAGNRLNGIVLQLKASGPYDIPAAYA